jgi:N-acetylglucosaminyldiphosphoundecaprenol N-acetyl-beta-D-mannosaminyltransferase
MTSRAYVRRAKLLGENVDLVTREGVMEFIACAAEAGRKAVVGNHNLHSIYLARKDRTMAAFFAMADLIEIDSMPMVHWARVLGLPSSAANRCTYLDWRDDFWKLAAERRWRVFFLGAADGVAEEAARRLEREWPGVQIATHNGYFDRTPQGEANQAVIEAINGFEPHVIMVGMGMPIQELWVSQNAHAIERGVILTVGAAFDYEAGEQGAAPRVLGDFCIEWLYRLILDPRRLSRRYLIEPWSLAGALVGDLQRYVLAGSAMNTTWRVFHDWVEIHTASAEGVA